MLFLEKESHSYENLYFDLLIHYTQIDQYNGARCLRISENKRKILNLDTLPQLVSDQGEKSSSLFQITLNLLKDSYLDISLIGCTHEQTNLTRKYFEFLHQNRDEQEKVLKGLENDLNGYMFLGESPNLSVNDLICFSFLYKIM